MPLAVLLLVMAVGATTQSSSPVLPPRASPLHPNYSFDPIDPKWHASKLYLDVEHDRGILPSDPDPKDKCFLMVDYAVDEHSPALKEIEFYPSGRVFTETDMHVHGVDMIARGDIYTRAFRDDGATLCFFKHDHDGKCVEGFSIAVDGTKEKVVNGRGTLTQPTDRGKGVRRFFGDGGEELIHVEEEFTYLHDSWGEWRRKFKGDEELSHKGETWERSVKGKVTSPRGDNETDSQDGLRRKYAELRKDFFAHLADSAKGGGFTLKDMSVDQYAAPTTQP